jgi:hypothetical protein
MPAKQGGGGHDGIEIAQGFSADFLGQARERSPLYVGEHDSPRAESSPQCAISAFRYSILAAACRSSQHAMPAETKARKDPGPTNIDPSYRSRRAICNSNFRTLRDSWWAYTTSICGRQRTLAELLGMTALTVQAPEIDPVSMVAALTLLGGAFAVLRGRRSKS